MKFTKLIVLAVLAIAVTSCNQDKIAELEKQNKELSAATSKKDSSMTEMFSTFNKIQANLKEIKAREGVIEVSSKEGETGDVGASINNDIETINQLMQENEKLMNDLNNKLSKSDVQIAEFKSMISNLNTRVDRKNKEIEVLSSELTEKKILIGQLYFRNDSLRFSQEVTEMKLENRIDDLNRAYYAYGTFKELKEKNVLTKEGGFLGIGKNEELKDNFNTEYFSELDIRKQTSFLLYADKAELATTHPKNSYKIMGKDGKADSLVITDADAFWKATKYLVVVVD